MIAVVAALGRPVALIALLTPVMISVRRRRSGRVADAGYSRATRSGTPFTSPAPTLSLPCTTTLSDPTRCSHHCTVRTLLAPMPDFSPPGRFCHSSPPHYELTCCYLSKNSHLIQFSSLSTGRALPSFTRALSTAEKKNPYLNTTEKEI